MAKVYIVGGTANEAIREMFKKTKEIEIIGMFPSVQNLTDEVIQKGISFLHLARAVLILDYGFTSSHYLARAKEFVLLQDALKSSNLANTKLYLATRDADLYSVLGKPEKGIPSILYLYAEVMILRGEYVTKTLSGIIQGRHDLTGIYHPEVTRANKINRMEDDRDKFVADSRTIATDILNYGKDEPISPFSNRDYVDSQHSATQATKREQEKVRQQRKEERASNTSPSKPPKKGKKEEENQDVVINITSPPPKMQVTVGKQGIKEAAPPLVQQDVAIRGKNLEQLRERFKTRVHAAVLSEKLAQDTGVIFFTGTAKSGVSGILANCADIYALNKRQVLVIDLDADMRMQLNYFPQYMERVQAQEGVANSLLQVFKGGAITTNAVSLTARIDMLAISHETPLTVDWWEVLETHLAAVLSEAKALYDLVLVDIPMHYLPACLPALAYVDKYVCVAPNKFYELDTLIHRTLPLLEVQIEQDAFKLMLRKTTLWLNQYRDTHVDKQQQIINKAWVRSVLLKLGNPYDTMQIAGESPFYDTWEEQFTKGVRYIWADDLALGVYQQLMTKVVW